ncbi:MAG TPA: DUF6143 family protein [Bacillota bacterium]|nr:DUF6143 family protein [Bacillota bacterium]
MKKWKNPQPVEVINTPYSVYAAFQGNYFFGQTEKLNLSSGNHAWGGLINPIGSGVQLFWNVYTISNFSRQPFTAEIWLNSTLVGKGQKSQNVSPSNLSLSPLTYPRVELQYAEGFSELPSDGIFSFIRRVEPGTTLTRHDFQGLIILPPGGSVIVLVRSPGTHQVQSRIAFGWWEENIRD